MRIIFRPEWRPVHEDGFRAAPVPAGEIWLHHSVTIAPDLVPPFDDDFAAVRRIEEIGEERFGRGMPYTFLVTPAGLIFEGHSIGRQGAHTAGHNTAGRGICLVGNYETSPVPGPMLDALVWLLVEGFGRGWWSRRTLNGGHRDVKATACPGKHAYALIPEINRRAANQGGGNLPGPESIPSMVYGERSDNVLRLQQFMTRTFASYNRYTPTGYYGDATTAGIREFQRRTGVVGGDGRNVGPPTKAQLFRFGFRG